MSVLGLLEILLENETGTAAVAPPAPVFFEEVLPFGPGDISTTFAPEGPIQGIPTDEIIDALLAGVVRVHRRVEIYESDGTVPFNIPHWNARLIEGNVSVDRTRDERRNIDCTLENYDNELATDPFNGFWHDKILKVFWGIRYYDAYGSPRSYETQIGEFMIDRIGEGSFPHTVKVTGRDYAKKCLNTKLGQSLVFPPGVYVETIITALAANAGINKIDLPETGQYYNLDTVFERGTERWNVMKQIADSIGYEIFFRGDGYLTMRPYPDPSYSPIAWIFRPGELDGTLVRFDRSTSDSLIKNKIIVTGSSSTNASGYTTSVYAEASNTDPVSPTRISRIGERTEIIESDFFSDYASALAYAQKRLAVGSLEQFDIDFESVIIPWLEGSDIIDIDQRRGSEINEYDDPFLANVTVPRESSDYVPARFLLSSFTLPLGLGTMQGQAKRVTIVGSTEVLEYH